MNTSSPITIRMPKAKLKKWLAALRSGEYKQGRNMLYNEHNGSFCCLGVLQHAVDRGNVECDGNSHDKEFRDMPTLTWLREHKITFRYSLGDKREGIDPFLPALNTNASIANDKMGSTFEEIADAIEACAEGF